MIPLLLPIGSAPASDCPPLQVTSVPSAPMVVPVDARFTAVVGNPRAGCDGLRLTLEDARGVGVPSVVKSRWDEYELRAQRLLDAGAGYVFRIEDPNGPTVEIPVTAGEPERQPTAPPPLRVEALHRCDDVEVDVTLVAEPTSPATGVLTVQYQVDGFGASELVPVQDQSPLTATETLHDGAVVCATLELVDLSGDLVWSTDGCADAEPCPTYEPPASVVYTMAPVCDGQPATHLVADVDLPAAGPAARGDLVLEVTTSGLGPLGEVWRQSLVGEDGDVTADVLVPGGLDVCFDLLLQTLQDDEVWRVGPHCSEEPLTCPAGPRTAGGTEGCGCASPAVAPAPLALALVAGVGRRRARGTPLERQGGST